MGIRRRIAGFRQERISYLAPKDGVCEQFSTLVSQLFSGFFSLIISDKLLEKSLRNYKFQKGFPNQRTKVRLEGVLVEIDIDAVELLTYERSVGGGGCC